MSFHHRLLGRIHTIQHWCIEMYLRPSTYLSQHHLGYHIVIHHYPSHLYLFLRKLDNHFVISASGCNTCFDLRYFPLTGLQDMHYQMKVHEYSGFVVHIHCHHLFEYDGLYVVRYKHLD